MSTVGPGLWRGNGKRFKMRHTHCRTWNMARKLTNDENENLTWQVLEYGEKH